MDEIAPHVISSCASYSDLVEKIADTINSQFSAEINPKFHYTKYSINLKIYHTLTIEL